MVLRPPSRRRQAILDTAAGLFAEHGFHGVTVEDIGAARGVSGPSLYHHFRSKEELLGELLEAISVKLLEDGTRCVEAAAAPEALVALLGGHIDFALERPDLIVVHGRDLVHVPAVSQRRVKRLQASYVELWVDALLGMAPELGRPTARAAAHAVIGLVNSTPHSARVGRDAMRALLERLALGALESATGQALVSGSSPGAAAPGR